MDRSTDVLIIGGGGAALRAALAAHDGSPHVDVTLVTKGELGASGVTATACSDRMAFHATLPSTEPGGPEAWRYHADDIYRIGGEVSDADLAETLARDASAAFAYLDAAGVPWARRPDGTVDQFVTDGSVYARACYTGPYTANHIERALLRRLQKTDVHVIDHHMVTELLLDERGRVSGAALVSQTDGRIGVISAPAIVLATGGAGQVYGVSVFPPDCTGDGYAMAYRAGAELVNMEFIQIGLCSLETGLACSGSMMRALPRLVDEKGREFLSAYLSDMTPEQRHSVLFAKGASWPVSYREPSHVIDVAVAKERDRGHRAYLDYGANPSGLDPRHLPEAIKGWYEKEKGSPVDAQSDLETPLSRLMAINRASVEWLAERGVDLRAGDRVEIAPAVQHFQGGIKIRTKGETNVPGLYAAGEAAGGQHGANRPGGNALLDSQVFGRIAGENAAAFARQRSHRVPISALHNQYSATSHFGEGGLSPDEMRDEVKRLMATHCSVYRTGPGLDTVSARLQELHRAGVDQGSASCVSAYEALNMLQVARMITLSATTRSESRGPHLRFGSAGDLQPIARDDARWMQYIVLSQGRADPQAEVREPVRPSQLDGWRSGGY